MTIVTVSVIVLVVLVLFVGLFIYAQRHRSTKRKQLNNLLEQTEVVWIVCWDMAIVLLTSMGESVDLKPVVVSVLQWNDRKDHLLKWHASLIVKQNALLKTVQY